MPLTGESHLGLFQPKARPLDPASRLLLCFHKLFQAVPHTVSCLCRRTFLRKHIPCRTRDDPYTLSSHAGVTLIFLVLLKHQLIKTSFFPDARRTQTATKPGRAQPSILLANACISLAFLGRGTLQGRGCIGEAREGRSAGIGLFCKSGLQALQPFYHKGVGELPEWLRAPERSFVVRVQFRASLLEVMLFCWELQGIRNEVPLASVLLQNGIVP